MNKIKTPHFISFPLKDAELVDLLENEFPCRVRGWGVENDEITLDDSATHFCYVHAGEAEVTWEVKGTATNTTTTWRLVEGMYACLPGRARLKGGRGMVFSSMDYRGVFMVGGPIEAQGRLKYIDGCSDSLLIPACILGDPCLNHLHFPSGIDQTKHTHPSFRAGIIVSGSGICSVPDENGNDVQVPLKGGDFFYIPAGGIHGFVTRNESMDVIAFHPDSDFGPEHDNHPMINRTIVNGVSASEIEEIKTK